MDAAQLAFAFSLALNHAWEYQLCTLPNPAVGAVLLGKHGEIIALGAHKIAGAPHAEVLALQQGYAILSGDSAILALQESRAIHDYLRANHRGIFHDCTLLITLEPCNHEGKTPACAALLAELKPREVLFALPDPTQNASGGGAALNAAGIRCAALDDAKLVMQAKRLLHPFTTLQQKGFFVCFKVAQRLDGSLDGGLISSLESRTLTHTWRGAFDLLAISGKTIRNDRPTLDTRLAQTGSAPDVLILTRDAHALDRSIPLFHVERNVHFADSPDIFQSLHTLGNYKNIMIEGGAELFASVDSHIDMIALFLAPNMAERGHVRLHSRLAWNMWHSQQTACEAIQSSDVLLWLGRD